MLYDRTDNKSNLQPDRNYKNVKGEKQMNLFPSLYDKSIEKLEKYRNWWKYYAVFQTISFCIIFTSSVFFYLKTYIIGVTIIGMTVTLMHLMAVFFSLNYITDIDTVIKQKQMGIF